MDAQTRFDFIADILLVAYASTDAFSRTFTAEQGNPPTTMTKVHYLRSVVQAQVHQSDGFQLGPSFAEFGRCEIIELATAERFLLRSQRNLEIEFQQPTLFDDILDAPAGLVLLIYEFTRTGLWLGKAGATMRPKSKRIYAVGPPTPVGVWAYDGSEEGPVFDQGAERDPFKELGDLDFDEGVEGGDAT